MLILKKNTIVEFKDSNMNFLMPGIILNTDIDSSEIQCLIGPKISLYKNNKDIINIIGIRKKLKINSEINLNITNDFFIDYNNWTNNNYGFGLNICINDFLNNYNISYNNINNFIISSYIKNDIYILINKNNIYKQFFCPLWILLKYKN